MQSQPSLDSVISALEERIQRNLEISQQVEEFKNQLAPSKRRLERPNLEIDARWLRNTHTRQREQFVDEHLRTLRVRKFEWDDSEVETLRSLVTVGDRRLRSEEVDWKAVSQKLKRSPADCRIKFEHFIEVNCEPWTKEEDLHLVSLATKYNGVGWDVVAEEMGTGRTAAACFQRYQRTLNPNLGATDFTLQEDMQLLEYMKSHSTASWGQITADLGFARIPDQVARRWKMLTRPASSFDTRWTRQQDAKLAKLAKMYNERNWAEIAEFFPDKNDNRCRERYQDHIKPGRQAKALWTPEEDEQLLVSIIMNGVGNWANIAKDIPGRTDRGCLQRWRQIDPEAARDYYEKKRITRSVAVTSSSAWDPEGTELTADDLLRVIVPAPDSGITADFSSIFPSVLFEEAFQEPQHLPPELGGPVNQ